MAKKGPMPVYKSVDDYINSQSKEAQEILKELREIILEGAPDAVEVSNNKVPLFTLVKGAKKDKQIMMAAYAKFVSFYPFPSVIEEFSVELKEYKLGKGSVQFPLNKPLPRDLILRMVKYRTE